MNAVQRFFWGHLAAAALALAGGYALAGMWGPAGTFLALGVVWAAAQRRGGASGAGGIGGLMMVTFILAGAGGILAGIPGWLGILAVVAALGAWDLDHLLRRLAVAGRVDYASGLARAHLRRLALVEGAGFLAGLAAVVIRGRLPFWLEALLALLAVLGLSRVIQFVRSQAEE